MNRERAAAIRTSFPLNQLFDGLRRVGEDKYRGVCPFHGGDNFNGFGVGKHRGEWKWTCFTGDCGSGDAIAAHKLLHGGTFLQALNALDGGAALERPPAPKRAPSMILVCDACRDERLEVEARTYGNGTTRPLYVSDILMEVACAAGWEKSALLDAFVGPNCLAGKRKQWNPTRWNRPDLAKMIDAIDYVASSPHRRAEPAKRDSAGGGSGTVKTGNLRCT